MNIFTRNIIRSLSETAKPPCISIYMPTHRAGKETEQDPIRLKNSLTSAEKQLTDNGLTRTEVGKILSPAHKLLQDTIFWRYQSDGLALFLSPEVSHHYRFPFSFKESVVVDDYFHFRPLLPLLTSDSLFYVLALSQKRVALFQGTRYSAHEIIPEDLPAGLAETLASGDFEKHVNYHTVSSRGGTKGTGNSPAIRHGAGGSADAAGEEILHYFQKIDRGLHEVLKDEDAPLVVASVDYLLPIYRKANTYPTLMDEGISGNPEEQGAEQLHEKAWVIVQPYFHTAQQAAETRYGHKAGTPYTSDSIEAIVPASCNGLVDTLFVATHSEKWGTFGGITGNTVTHDKKEHGDRDLLDFAALCTLQNSGKVFALDPETIPDDSPLAAIFRYKPSHGAGAKIAVPAGGEHSVFYSFEESRESILHRSEAIRIPVAAMIKRGTLSLVKIEPLQYTVSELTSIIRREVEEKNLRVICLDSISGYRMALKGEDLVTQMHALSRNIPAAVFIVQDKKVPMPTPLPLP